MLAGAMVGCYLHLMCQVLRSRFAAVYVRRLRPARLLWCRIVRLCNAKSGVRCGE